MENLKFPMQESHSMPPRSAENSLLQPGVDGFPSAGDRPTNDQPPVTSLEDSKGNNLISKAAEQHVFQLLLQKLQERKPEDIQTIVEDYTCKLMFNQFGSDVILKLFEVCDEEQKNQLVSSVTADVQLFILVCLDSQGSESMKKFLGCPMTPKQVSHIINVFSYFTVPLVNHQFGSQVINHCLKIFPANETQPILEMIAQYGFEIALDQNGSALLQVLISADYLKGGALYRIVETIVSYSFNLSYDQFGTCVIHHLIGLKIPNLLEILVDQLQGAFTVMWIDKLAAIVVRKLMCASKKKYAPQIIDEMIRSRHFLYALLYNTHDSFLLKFAKVYAKGTTRKTLNDLICQYSLLLRTK